VLETLIPKPQTQTFEYSRKTLYTAENARRVVKLFAEQAEDFERHKALFQEAVHEAKNLQQAGHMRTKNAVDTQHETVSGAIVMERLVGGTLRSIIKKDRSGERVLTTAQRYELSIALLEALETQVTGKGIVHNDLKPDNVMVSWDPLLKVTIFDFGSSRNAMDPESKGGMGSLGYASPEQFDDVMTTAASDMYSAGVILAQIWRDTDAENLFPQIRQKRHYQNVFDGMPGFSESSAGKAIHAILTKTLCEDPTQRITVTDALGKLKALYQEYQSVASYRDGFAALKKTIEDYPWKVSWLSSHKITVAHGREISVSATAGDMWKRIETALRNPKLTLHDCQRLEKAILTQAHNAAAEFSLSRNPSTQAFYEKLGKLEKIVDLEKNPVHQSVHSGPPSCSA
jgi:serine/threonine protein kinase